ncbi:MAG: hypothetical protein ACR2FF_04105 [Mycobacteriales bacterium]
MTQSWPVADLDPIRRLRVMAASIRGAGVAERVVPATVDQVWAVASDLENELPHLVRDFRSVRVSGRDGDRLTMHARGLLGQRARFDVVLEPGWCWCQSRFLLCGMAAAPHPDGTTFGFLGGVRLPVAGVLAPLLSTAGRPLIAGVLDRLEQRVELRQL